MKRQVLVSIAIALWAAGLAHGGAVPAGTWLGKVKLTNEPSYVDAPPSG